MIKQFKKVFIVIMAVMVLFMLIFPLLITSIAIASPFVVIGTLFGSNNNDEEIIEILDEWVKMDSAYILLAEYYQPAIQSEQRVDVPLNWLVIVNIFQGIEKVSDEVISMQIQSAINVEYIKEPMFDENGNPIVDEEGNQVYLERVEYSLASLDEYLNRIKSSGVYTVFDGVNNDTIEYYIEKYSYINVYAPNIDSNGNSEYIYPFIEKAFVSAEYGWYAPFGETIWHNGIDLAYNYPNQCGMPIYAVSDGTVVYVQNSTSSDIANIVGVQNGDVVVKYVHMRDNYYLPIGHTVSQGDYIGAIGTTGISTGCHLHLQFEVNGQTVNPRLYIDFD